MACNLESFVIGNAFIFTLYFIVSMYYWLQSKGVSSHRNTIVHALAEKVDMFFPGTYDRELYNAKQASGDCDAETK